MVHFLVHEGADTVGVAAVDIKAGEIAKGLYMDTQRNIEVTARDDIPLGHKLALRDHESGDNVIKYNHDIGTAVGSFHAGNHVHIHNLKTKRW